MENRMEQVQNGRGGVGTSPETEKVLEKHLGVIRSKRLEPASLPDEVSTISRVGCTFAKTQHAKALPLLSCRTIQRVL